MGARVFRHQVVRVVGSDEWNTGAFRKFDKRFADATLRLETVLLYLEKVIPFSEYLFKLDRRPGGLLHLHGPRHVRFQYERPRARASPRPRAG